jgi:uncharacterized alpha-E superfamily protein
MLSRVADSLYWMSRYLERAEHLARQLDIHLNLVLDQSTEAAGRRRKRLLGYLADVGEANSHSDYQFSNYLTFAADNSNTLVACVAMARENARQIREQITALMWEQLNQLYLSLQQINMENIWEGQPHEFYHAINERIYLCQGLIDSRMSHDQSWHFIRLGQSLERAAATAELVKGEVQVLTPQSNGVVIDQNTYLDWIGLLRGCAAFEAYSKLYTADIQPKRVVEFLTLNPVFPHSIRYAIDVVQSALQSIASDTETHKGARVNRLAGRLCAMLDYAQIDEIMETGLESFLDEIQGKCFQIHDAVYQTYISYPIEDKLAG